MNKFGKLSISIGLLVCFCYRDYTISHNVPNC